MKKHFYVIDAPDYGGLGRDTILDMTVVPPQPTKLHYEIESQPKCDLIGSVTSYLGSRDLARALKETVLSGIEFAEAKVTTSLQFRQFHPNASIGSYVWLKIVGRIEVDDFSLDKFQRMVVSVRALAILRKFNLDGCEIWDLGEAPTPEQKAERMFAEAMKRNRT